MPGWREKAKSVRQQTTYVGKSRKVFPDSTGCGTLPTCSEVLLHAAHAEASAKPFCGVHGHEIISFVEGDGIVTGAGAAKVILVARFGMRAAETIQVIDDRTSVIAKDDTVRPIDRTRTILRTEISGRN
jgi:hypothetical protein